MTQANNPPPSSQGPRWWDIAGGINNVVQTSHILMIILVGSVGYMWHVETSLNRHDMLLQQTAADHADDRRNYSDLRGDVEQIKISMASMAGDVKSLVEELRQQRLGKGGDR